MRKQIVGAGPFPLQRRTERIAVNCDQHQVALSGEMLGRRLCGLRRGREMDEAVTPIDIRSVIRAGGFGGAPRCPFADFVDYRHTRPRNSARPYRPLSLEAIIPIMSEV